MTTAQCNALDDALEVLQNWSHDELWNLLPDEKQAELHAQWADTHATMIVKAFRDEPHPDNFDRVGAWLGRQRFLWEREVVLRMLREQEIPIPGRVLRQCEERE